jgi:HemY protein
VKTPRLAALSALAAFILAGALLAAHLWRQHRRAAIVAAGVAEVPDLSRWPAELGRDVVTESQAAVGAEAGVGPLERLAALYCANSLAPQAEQALAALRQLEPRNARWPYLMADMRLRTGDQDGALPCLRAAAGLDPGYAPAWTRMGELLEGLGAADRAGECFEKAAAAAPASLRAEYDLILFRAEHGGGDSQRRRLEELCRAHPGVKELHELMAEMLAAARDPEGAARERRLAADGELNMGTEDPWVDDLSELCFDSNRLVVGAMKMRREGRFAETERMLKRVVRLAPQAAANPLAWDLLSNFYVKTGRPADARSTLEAAVREFPDEPQMHVLLARLLCAEHEPLAAVAVARPAVQRWPQHGELRSVLGAALHDAGEYAAAEAALREALRLDPTLTEAQYNLGIDLLDLGERDAARAAVAKALVMRPDYPEALYTVGEIYLDAGDFASAEAYVTRLCALNPGDPNARHLLAAWHLVKGAALRQAGKLEEADRQFRDGLAADPEFGALLGEEGSLSLERGRPEDAVAALEHYVRVEPGDSGGYLSLGRALGSLGRNSEAKAAFARGLEEAEKAGDQASAEEFRKLLGP